MVPMAMLPPAANGRQGAAARSDPQQIRTVRARGSAHPPREAVAGQVRYPVPQQAVRTAVSRQPSAAADGVRRAGARSASRGPAGQAVSGADACRALPAARPYAGRARASRRRSPLGAGLGLALLLLLLMGLCPHGQPDVPAGGSASQPAAVPAGERFVVVIDPGHGGRDGGAEGLGLDEAEMTWRTAQELLALLEADGRFAPLLTKAEDETLHVDERAAVANEAGAALFLSIHGNSDAASSRSHGFECYPTPPGRAHHEESLRFAELVAEAFGDAGARLRGEGGVRYLYYEHNSKKAIYEASDTSVHSDPSFGVLEGANCPAVLAEQCFVTSPDDLGSFGDEDGCKISAACYYQAICAWFGVEPLEG